jgi:predicted tellurium resistance membrane protein TerC
MAELFTIENAVALLTLASLEIVLGIDNIVFISILTGKLPPEQRAKARQLGLAIAMLARIALLLTIGWIMRMKEPLFSVRFLEETAWSPYVIHLSPSVKDFILIAGGLFLMVKATLEIHHKIEGGESGAGVHPDPARGLGVEDGGGAAGHGSTGSASAARKQVTFSGVIIQILLIDLVFSIDSVITAVGMAKHIPIMIAAIVIAVIVMMVFAGIVSGFIERHPTVKMLALAFLMLIGVMLVADGLGEHLERGYVYFAMGFSLVVELLNLRVRQKAAAAMRAVAG